MTSALLAAEAEGPEAFRSAIGAPASFDWPPEHHDAGTRAHLGRLLDLPPADAVFAAYYIMSGNRPVGTCGFKGAPDQAGRVDIGYSVVATEQRKGHATAAVRQLLRLAFADPRVTRVVAETIPSLVASQRTAETCGFVLVDRRSHADLGAILTYCCPRPQGYGSGGW